MHNTWKRKTLLLVLGVAVMAVASAEGKTYRWGATPVTVTEEPSSNSTETRTATNISTSADVAEVADSKSISLPTFILSPSSDDKKDDTKDLTKNQGISLPNRIFGNPELNAGIGGAILGAGGAVLVGTLLNKAGQAQPPCRRRRRDTSDTEDVTADTDAKARFIDPFNLFGSNNNNYDCYQPSYGSYQPSYASPGYQAPSYNYQSSYDTSRASSAYQQPANVNYQAPTANYGSYQSKQPYQAAPQSGYGNNHYQPPQQSYGSYQATQQTYQLAYQPSQSSYQAPQYQSQQPAYQAQQPSYQAQPQYKAVPSYSSESYNAAESYNREQYNNPTPSYPTPQPSYNAQASNTNNNNNNGDFGYHPSQEYNSDYLYRSSLPVEAETGKDKTASNAAYADKAAADQKKTKSSVRFEGR